ncbi:putative ABC transport system permease protein [Prolixibacter denitrificans]|uniref:ABC transporter permease n=2 Tax=Prolixibacter denitrificans TaxID=1541063 RepID=A0A2P8CDZ9_9BACT|nr:ABC transporter permease [Prolixibacter denitrificans]PSK83176.1 putative ABC transport system permease protein [Prolixibacter denitrificans]GET21941.1 ABC transporter permease [Prolixibacter denitrificans]
MDVIFFKLALRNILKNKMNSIINILGFSIGIAACLFLFLFVKYEFSFDKFFPNHNRIYRVVSTTKTNRGVSSSAFVYYPVAPDMKSEIPGIDAYCRVTMENPAKVYSGNALYSINNLRFADDNFFPFFHFKLLTGNPTTVLNNADKIVLSEHTAKQLFGNSNPIGKTLKYNHKLLTVNGIAANPPRNTHLTFDAIISLKYIGQSDDYKGWDGGWTMLSYLELSKGTSPQQIEKAFPDFLQKKINDKWNRSGWSYSASLQNIENVHLSDGSIQYDCSSNRSKSSIYIIGSITLLILLLAIVNYIILYTAQRLAKKKDLGLLKIFGAEKYALIFQTFIEVLILTATASLVGIILLQVFLPFLNTYLQTTVSMQESVLSIIVFLLIIISLLSLVVSFFSSRKVIKTKSIEALKDTTMAAVSGKMRNRLLVSFQFAVVILLLVSVFVVARQNSFLLNHELGFDKDNVLSVYSDDEFMNNELDGFKQDLLQLASVRAASLSSQTVGNGLTANGYKLEGEQQRTIINALYTDADFFKCFDVHIIRGRNFRGNKSLDKNAVLVNQQLVKRAGWKNPIGKEIDRDGKLNVIGVVNNFNFKPLTSNIQPLIIMANPSWDGWGYQVVNIRFQTADIQSLVHQIKKLWKNRFPETPFQISFLDDALASNYQSYQAQQKIIGFFSLLAMFIALIGLFGLTVFTTRQRTKEIGIRKVNGAKVSEVMTLLNMGFIKWVGIAFAIAAPVAWFAMNKWLENFAYRTSLSWWIFALAGILALVIALLTVSWQSWKAATKNPVEALRYE